VVVSDDSKGRSQKQFVQMQIFDEQPYFSPQLKNEVSVHLLNVIIDVLQKMGIDNRRE
jgi:hypothetical protein